LAGNLDRIVTHADDGNWLWRLTNRGVSFDCVWPSRYAERYLWSGVEKVVLMSATLRPKAMQLLGIKPKDYWFKEWESPFPAENLRVVWVKTGRMGKESADWPAAVARANEIYGEWGHLKGIVHTPSYRLAERLQADTNFGRNMILSKPGEAVKAAEEFRMSTTKNILVSPSFAEGWDFPAAECEWIHIPKLPFPDKSDPIVQTRIETDREWYDYETMQKFEQGCYRGRRSETCRCTVIVTDDAVGNFRRYAHEFATRNLKVRDAKEVPKAP
jgi:Rad3-related DNA helicase